MEPFSLTVVCVAGYHFAVADAIAVAVGWFVGVNFTVFVVSLHAAAGICVRGSELVDDGLRDRTGLLVAFFGGGAFCGS